MADYTFPPHTKVFLREDGKALGPTPWKGDTRAVWVDGSLDALPSKVDVARTLAVGFRYDEDSDVMMQIWSPKFKKQSDESAVSTILAQHLDKDFVSALPSPATAADAIIYSRDLNCGRFPDDSWISYPMGELLDKQSKSPSSSSSSSFPPSSSFMSKILKSVDQASLSLDIVQSDQSSTSSPENATSSFSPPHDIRYQSRSTLESAINESGEASAPDSSDSEVPMGSTSPPQQLIGSVEASENPSSSQQGLNHKLRGNLDLRGQWRPATLAETPCSDHRVCE